MRAYVRKGGLLLCVLRGGGRERRDCQRAVDFDWLTKPDVFFVLEREIYLLKKINKNSYKF